MGIRKGLITLHKCTNVVISGEWIMTGPYVQSWRQMSNDPRNSAVRLNYSGKGR